MESRGALKTGLEMADLVCMSYLNDLSDSDLMQRPHQHCNHINWQIGHLIASEHQMMSNLSNYPKVNLPDGFAAKYSKEAAASDNMGDFCSKSELMSAYKLQREATFKYLDACSDEDLDKATGIDYAPTIGVMIALQGSHWLMHCGQWVIVRRNLGKPVVI